MKRNFMKLCRSQLTWKMKEKFPAKGIAPLAYRKCCGLQLRMSTSVVMTMTFLCFYQMLLSHTYTQSQIPGGGAPGGDQHTEDAAAGIC